MVAQILKAQALELTSCVCVFGFVFILCMYFWLHGSSLLRQAFSNCSEQGLLSSCSSRASLTAVASLVEHGL